MKLTETFRVPSTFTVHVAFVPQAAASPPQPRNVEPGEAVADRRTLAPIGKYAVQRLPQSIPAGSETTEPVPSPASTTATAAPGTQRDARSSPASVDQR